VAQPRAQHRLGRESDKRPRHPRPRAIAAHQWPMEPDATTARRRCAKETAWRGLSSLARPDRPAGRSGHPICQLREKFTASERDDHIGAGARPGRM